MRCIEKHDQHSEKLPQPLYSPRLRQYHEEACYGCDESVNSEWLSVLMKSAK